MIAEDDDTKVPVVAVVGFLPASKEGNLLKHILTGEHGKRVAVVRYADCLGVDGAELERCKCSQCVVDGVDLVETANGCAVACCRRHGDLAAALKKLKARQGCHLFSRLDKIIIEGADACDAADVHVAFLDQEVASFARLDAIVSCVRLEAKCDVDMGLIQDWLHELRTEGAASDVFSVKGTLAVRHAPKQYRYAAVHLDAKNAVGCFGDEAWAGDRTSTLCLVGRNLDATKLRARFGACLATAENYRRIVEGLRFKIGDAVECYCEGKGWERGRVVKHLYQEAEWARSPGFVAPYQVRLDGGCLIYCPADDNALIRRAACRRAGPVRRSVTNYKRRGVRA